MFQARHYNAIAQVLDQLQLDGDATRDRELAEQVASALAAMFASDNPNFDYHRFMKACGLSGLSGSGRGSVGPTVVNSTTFMPSFQRHLDG